ncbi:hypothetical protein G7Y89_g14149 [Cudoniella acicularis]|uniref:Rhodanese domain-containing protein n=1 Tax=Cudoniella acicularis TaxID=354080 RepID=A0A8H4VVS3_9HELO|nr:hypothetical protein G7Y89_g14149 [Cudoniella acicularis]
MAQTNMQNVFKGPNSLVNYFNPDLQPPLPLVELPEKLNPFRVDNVRIYAKMLTALPAQNVKMFPALNMLLQNPAAASKSIVEASSGSTAISLGLVSHVLWGNEDVCAYVTNKKHPDQLRLLRFFGLKVSLYGGIAQQEPDDPRGIMWRLRRLAKHDENVSYPGQYDNDNSVFVMFSATQRQGLDTFLNSRVASFPWRETIDSFETVASVDSYDLSMQMSREGLICGPSSGEALCGLLQYLQKAKDAGKLKELAEQSTGEISCVIICCDLPYQYMDGYFQKLRDEDFPPILNEILLKCDQEKYDERWELTPEGAAQAISQKMQSSNPRNTCSRRSCRKRTSCKTFRKSQPMVLDLRQGSDFDKNHIRGSISSPLKNLTVMTQRIFEDSNAICFYWKNLNVKFDAETEKLGLKHSPLLVLCYDGDISQLATSILRARSYNAFSVMGGFPALFLYLKARGRKEGE